MSLAHARLPDGKPFALPGPSPFEADALVDLVGVDFLLPAEDPFVQGTGTEAHAYLDAARHAWEEYPDWMDFLDLGSPAMDVKRAARDLYLHWWAPWLKPGRVLDLGCGIGRLALPLLDRGSTVIGVDADLKSLRRLAWRAPGRPGRLDLHWSSVHTLPDEFDLDVIIANEVLCYVPDVQPVIAELARRLRPGGALLLSMEAKWGWALATDAGPVTLDVLRGKGPVVVEDDRWVQTWDKPELVALLEGAGLKVERIVPTHYVPDGPLERAAPEGMFLEQMLQAEQMCREHPVWGPLNRIWTVAATRP